MKIINLIEDTPGARGCLFEHGLSFYVETAHHKLLVDTGATDAFLKNADALGIDLSDVDTVLLSHGHYDHTGGLLAFAERNPYASIYLHQNATGAFYSLKDTVPKYISADAAIAALPQIRRTEGDIVIDGELTLFSGVTGRRLHPRGNGVLQKKCGDIFVPDTFDHEQYLVITEGTVRVLFSGCAHNGILNILDTYRDRFGGAPTHVISGFHTTRREYTPDDDALIDATAAELLKTDTVFYSGHCTGAYPIERFRRIMGEKLQILHSGDSIMETT